MAAAADNKPGKIQPVYMLPNIRKLFFEQKKRRAWRGRTPKISLPPHSANIKKSPFLIFSQPTLQAAAAAAEREEEEEEGKNSLPSSWGPFSRRMGANGSFI